MTTIKTIVTIVAAQFIFLFAFGGWGLLAIPVLAVVAFGKMFWTAYNLEHLRLAAVEARARADEAAREAEEAEEASRAQNWHEFVPTRENITVN